MKKVFLLVLACVSFCGISRAQDIPDVMWMTLTSEHGFDRIKWYQAPDASDATAKNGYDAPEIFVSSGTGSGSEEINFYHIAAYGNMAAIYTPDWRGKWMVVRTNSVDEEYTITFETIYPETLSEKLVDYENDSLIDIVKGETYKFTAPKNVTLDKRFQIYKPGEFKVCTTFDHVEIYENQGTDNIVVTNAAGDTIVDEAPVKVYHPIDLSGKPAGHYFLTVNGETYEFCNKPQPKE